MSASAAEARAAAMRFILLTLRNPINLMTLPTREEAQRLAREYKITAEELLDAAIARARKT